MVRLEARKLGKFVLFGFGAKRVNDKGRHEDSSDGEDGSSELVVIAGDGMEEGRIQSGHDVDG